MVGGCRFNTIMERHIRQVKDRGRTGGENGDAPFLSMDEGIPVSCEFVAVFEEFEIPLHINTDLYKFGMAVDADPVGFGLLDFDSFFKNDSFSIWGRFKLRETKRKLTDDLALLRILELLKEKDRERYCRASSIIRFK